MSELAASTDGIAQADLSRAIGSPSRRVLVKVVGGASVGSFVEYYDLGAYGFLAATISLVFFPPGNDTAALLSTFAIFAVSFFARPIGGLIWGRLGDRIGRKRTLATVIIIMSIATMLIGFLPGYASIGALAPTLLVVLRFVQGISAGGEITGAAAFVSEYSPEGRRGLLTSWIQASTTCAMLAGIVTASILNATLSTEAMQNWGWRIPFLLAAPLGIVGLYIRNNLEETPKFQELQESREATQQSIPGTGSDSGAQRRAIALAVAIGAIQTVAFYVLLSYLPTYLVKQIGLSQGEAYLVLGIAATVLMLLIPPMGALSDKIGRRWSLIAATLGFLTLSYPSFLLITYDGFRTALIGQLVLVVPGSLAAASLLATQGELFPTRVRYTGHAIAMGIVAAVFGGSAPFVAQALTSATGSLFVPAYMIMFAAAISFVASLVMKETAKNPLRLE
ncbi:L-Proline/Glycine betaine transporter ProP [Rhodococcus wratislaviensis]|uniref:Putative proline/betaine transporter n=1 Tax=Rhodococcus wratislaviensis TaxID=44752 RepID=A0A402CM63_RHOWR|nr:MFS transporter [Rhodococcus wratislaviensis]GCE44625.1 L-Proline/Glycine betaine transporter ProP [Rhodococcus wratislaviensis]